MANYNKSFSFRNGIQVDDGNFVINPNGLVGIGTTIPTEVLDVRGGTLKVVGLVTVSDLYVTGFSTFTEVRLGSGIKMSSNSGIITATAFYGNGATLSNLPTSQWQDIDVGLGFTSIYNRGYVGVATNDPRYFLQVGANPSNSQSGVGINSTGDIKATGIITASYFSGDGASLTGLNASNISSGTIDNAYLPVLNNNRFPSNISITGIITAGIASFTTLNSVSIAATGNVNITGIVTALGGFVGNVTGTASTATVAQGLTGTPNITVGLVSATNVNSSTSLTVGTSGTSFNVTSTGNVGIGTSIPTSDIQLRKENPIVEILSTTGQSRLSIGQSVGLGNSTGIFRFGNSPKTFDIINNDTGNINMYLHNGTAGINTGRFAWLYGQSNTELASLTYDGNFGIGLTNPSNNFHVVGTSTVTGDSYVGGDLEILGSLSFGSGSNRNVIDPTSNSVLNKVNLNVTSGVSTVATVLVSGGSSIGIGTTSAIVGFDARQSTGLINSLGIGTDNVRYLQEVALCNMDATLLMGQVGIGTTQIDLVNGSALLVNSGSIRIEGNNDLIIPGYGSIGVNSSFPIGAIDLRYANYSPSIRASFYPPVLNTTERNNITPTYVSTGAIIYNSSTGNHQAYDGSSWAPIGLTGTPDITVGTANITTLKVGTAVTINSAGIASVSTLRVGTGVTINSNGNATYSGIITASNGFSSGIGTAVKITTVGNKLTFTVVGVGSTTLTLF
jgi:hypothetical protein